jgi:hypothetical protein
MQSPQFSHNSSDGVYKLNNTAMNARIVYQKDGRSISTDRLRSEIEAFVKFSNEYVENLLEALYRIIEEGEKISTAQNTVSNSTNEYVNTYQPAILNYINRMGVRGEQLEFIKREKYQLHVEALAPRKIDGKKHELFKYVLFLTREELADLNRELNQLNVSKSPPAKLRMELQNAWKSLVKNHFGDKNEQEFENKSISEINQMVFGLPSLSKFIQGVKLKDITQPDIFKEEQLRKYMKEISIKSEELRRIFNQPKYEYSFFSNDISYYWIDQDLLP